MRILAPLFFLFLALFFIASPAPAALSTGEAEIGGPFSLTDQNGKTVHDTDLRGKFLLVFFGFTRCPDECPLAAGNMSLAMLASGAKADKIVPLFISVDPEYDTPAKLKSFLAPLDKHFVGLTGTDAQITAVTKEYKVYAQVRDKGVDHSAYIYLMGPDGKYITHFPHDATSQALTAGLQKAVP